MGYFKLIGPGTDGLYKYGGATIELSSVGTRHWWATVRFSSQEIDFEAQSSQEALEKAMAWVDAAPEHPRDFYGCPRSLGETRYPKLPEPKHHFVSRRVEGGPPHRERKQSFAGYDFTSGPYGTTIHRQHIDPSAPGDYGADPLGDGKFRMVPSGDIVDFDERNRRLARKGGMREAAGHRVADFNTLDALIEHAKSELGATHVSSLLRRGTGEGEVKLYFPRGGQYPYEEARTWRKGGYWHAEGPGARTGVQQLPPDAVPIEQFGRNPGQRRSFGYTDQRQVVRDYIAVDPRDRQVAGPFKNYGDARKEADRTGGAVKFVPSKGRATEARHRRRKSGRSSASDDRTIEGERYANSQLEGEYFQDWIRQQLLEASQMPPEDVLPLETKRDAMVIARNMLQDLEQDAKRDLNEDADFWEGFRSALYNSREWLADELLQIKSEMRRR